MFQIMVVEDDISTLKLMKAVLLHAGYEVFKPPENGEVALEIMDRRHIDLIVLGCDDAGWWTVKVTYRAASQCLRR